MKYAHICHYCGKKFWAKAKVKKYCSKRCLTKGRELQRERCDQLCATCGRAVLKCSWSKDFKPVDGWDAIPTVVHDSEGDFTSYKIMNCPLYIYG